MRDALILRRESGTVALQGSNSPAPRWDGGSAGRNERIAWEVASMYFFLTIIAPILAGAALGLNLLVAFRGRGILERAWGSALRRIFSRSEASLVRREAHQAPEKKKVPWKVHVHTALTTRLGIWGVLACAGFVVFWVRNWVSPGYPLGYLSHFVGAWASGVFAATAILAIALSMSASIRFLKLQQFAGKTGLRGIWIARGSRSDSSFLEKLREAFAQVQRIEIIDFTGHELFVKGASEEGGPVASLLARHGDKEVRVLLFNPCARDIDPDRKHTTVLESQLSAMEISRENFESKLVATLTRINQLNRNRQKPIEVHLYAEKPSFRVIVAGETAFLGSIDSRDTAGEFPLYELGQKSEAASLHAAARAHFLRVWGDSLPVEIEASTSAAAMPSQESPENVLAPAESSLPAA